MSAIQTISLSKDFKGLLAVKPLDLSIEQGELFALLGLNGAGKTTTIKMLCGLLRPTGGDATLLGDSILTNANKIKQKINVSPQETAIAPHLSVQENLEFIAMVYGATKNEARTKATEMMNMFQFIDRAKSKAVKLSGGMKRRLSIAMALITNPEILFLDEPTLGLDIVSRRALWKILLGLKGKVTMVMTTHYLEEAEALSDRIAIMHEGSLLALGTAKELKDMTKQTSFDEAFLTLTGMGGIS